MSVPMTGTPELPETRDDAKARSDLRDRRRRARSLAIALALAALVLIVYLVTIVKRGPGVVERSL